MSQRDSSQGFLDLLEGPSLSSSTKPLDFELCHWMSNMLEMTHIHNRESDHGGSPSTIPDTKHRSDTSLGDEDVEQTPTSSVPLIPPFDNRHDVRGSLLISAWQWALVLVPAISVAYLIFCYVVHYRVVPANIPGLSADSSTQFLSKQCLTPTALTNVQFPGN